MTTTNSSPAADNQGAEKSPPNVPVDFILKHTSDGGVGLLLACLRTGEPYWRSLIEGGIADRLSSSRSQRTTFLREVVYMKDARLAEEILRTCLNKLPAPKRKKFFDCPANDQDSSVIHSAMVTLSKIKDAPARDLAATIASPYQEIAKLIVRLAHEVKADFSLPQKVRFKDKDPIKVSPIVSCMYGRDIPTLRAYFELGHSFGKDEIDAVGMFVTHGEAFGVDLLRFAIGDAGVDPELFRAAASAEKAPREAMSVVSAALARKAVDDVIAKRAPQPG
jgi:hypothetical protein